LLFLFLLLLLLLLLVSGGEPNLTKTEWRTGGVWCAGVVGRWQPPTG
jgi:hypothetical protein